MIKELIIQTVDGTFMTIENCNVEINSVHILVSFTKESKIVILNKKGIEGAYNPDLNVIKSQVIDINEVVRIELKPDNYLDAPKFMVNGIDIFED